MYIYFSGNFESYVLYRYLLSRYGQDAAVDKILRGAKIHLVPTLNPDSASNLPKGSAKCKPGINTDNGSGKAMDESFVEIGGQFFHFKECGNLGKI